MCLYNLNNNSKCTVESAPSNGLLRSLGIRKGISLSIMTRQLAGGPIVVQIGRRSIAIGRDVAEQIIVKED